MFMSPKVELGGTCGGKEIIFFFLKENISRHSGNSERREEIEGIWEQLQT